MLDGAELRAIVERNFRVYEMRDEKAGGQVIARLFYIMFPPGEFDARYEAVLRDVRERDREALVFLRHDGGEDVLFVADRPAVAPNRIRLHVILLVATILTTVTAGALYWSSFRDHDKDLGWSVFWSPEHLLWGGLTFALPVMLILAIHETAHYLAAKRHGLRATLPFFIPLPPFVPPPLGTLGAFISLKDPLPDRRALFDVGASGPIAGFLVALPVVILGAWLTGVAAEPIPDIGRPELSADVPFGIDDTGSGKATMTFHNLTEGVLSFHVLAPSDQDTAWKYQAKAIVHFANGTVLEDSVDGKLHPGDGERRTLDIPANATSASVRLTWDDGLVRFGDPLLVWALDAFFDNDDYLTHPTFLAGWVGLLVTGINLLPASQLDGGHVARAVLGDRMRYAAYASVAGLLFLAFRFQSWMLMALFILLMGINHPPPLNDRTPLDMRRRVLAGFVLLVLVLTFVPQPLIP